VADAKKECTPLGLVGVSPQGNPLFKQLKKGGEIVEARRLKDGEPIHGDLVGNPLFKQLKKGGEIVEARRLKDGEPIHGDLVSLHQTPLSPLVFGSHVEYSVPTGHKGPARVSSPQYRSNYDEIDWGEELPN